MALLPSLLRVGSKRVSPSTPYMEPGHSSKLARSDTYARWTFLQTNFLESRLAELRRISLPSTLANRDFSLVRIVDEKSTPIKRGLPKKAS
jgi:hypothetical protein